MRIFFYVCCVGKISKTKKKRVIISDTNDLGTDKRVLKIAQSLAGWGFEIILVGRKIPERSLPNSNFKLKLFRMRFHSGVAFYTEFNVKLFFFLMFCKADIFLANDLDTLAANFAAAKLRRKPLVYDSHELYTEVPELVTRPHKQRIWLKLEKYVFPKLKYTYTVCASISDYYFKKYGIRPAVVRNIPTCKNSAQIIFVPKISDKKIILYQGALNMGRGIEYVVEAMSFIEDAVFVIIGTGTIDADLKQRVSELALNEKVMFLGRIPSEQLSAYTRQASVGVSVEQNIGLNYYFALPNKLFDYIHAEIPVLVSDLPEMRRIVETHKIGEITNDFSPENLAIMLKAMLSDDYKKTLINNILQAKKQLCWESESQVLKRIFYQIK